ncbi:MAG: MarC family protein [archaeon]|nr:MarC family protein [archaeon]MCP8314291.1 MarC family protein [archaeon]MCP8315771.1 MarC family protein [archaeon]MCP8320330.1 MarC family protein [archaeon]
MVRLIHMILAIVMRLVSLIENFINEVLKVSLALFIIVDPIGNVPIFISLTEGMSLEQRRKAFRTATIVSLILLLVFALLGQQILEVFRISPQSFMVAGGVLLVVIAIKILVFGGWEERKVLPESIGAVPIATPLLVGPGAITTTIVMLQTFGLPATLVSALIIFFTIWLVLRFIERIHKILGTTGSAVIARIMAIFIAAIAVGFVIDGIKYYFP